MYSSPEHHVVATITDALQARIALNASLPASENLPHVSGPELHTSITTHQAINIGSNGLSRALEERADAAAASGHPELAGMINDMRLHEANLRVYNEVKLAGYVSLLAVPPGVR